jgi:hypothetical protein
MTFGMNNLFAAIRDKADLRRRLEGYSLSVIFHVLLLFFLASVTITAGGDGFGFGMRPQGAKVHLAIREEMVDDRELEDLIEDIEVKPLEVDRTRPREIELPDISSISVPRPRPQQLDQIQSSFSPTSGAVGTLSAHFGSFLGGLRKTGLDIALVIDATASMQHVIDDIKANTSALVGSIQTLVPIARIGVVAFRDKGEEYVVRWTDLSFHGSKIDAFISNLKADGGGDWEEGVRDGLEAAIDELSWRRRAKRVVIVVGSSPPHEEDTDAITQLAYEFSSEGGIVSTIDVTKRMHERYERNLHLWLYGREPETISPLPDFYKQVRDSYRGIADNGGGEMAALGSEAELTEQILYFAFGSRWQKEVARYQADQ